MQVRMLRQAPQTGLAAEGGWDCAPALRGSGLFTLWLMMLGLCLVLFTTSGRQNNACWSRSAPCHKVNPTDLVVGSDVNNSMLS